MKKNYLTKKTEEMSLKIYQPEEGLPITKTVIKEQAGRMVTAAKEGEIDPIKVYTYAKYLENLSKALKEKSLDAALTEISKQGGKATFFGADIVQKESAVKYDYSNTPLWCQLDAQERGIKEQKKNLEDILKTLKEPTDVRDGDEMITYYPPIKTSTTTIETKFGK